MIPPGSLWIEDWQRRRKLLIEDEMEITETAGGCRERKTESGDEAIGEWETDNVEDSIRR